MALDRVHQLVALAEDAQAESLLLRHLRSSPNDPDALHLMCYILARTGRMDQALYYAQRAAAISPADPNVLTNLGNTLLGLGRESEAISMLERAVSLEHSGTTARHALALALNFLRRYLHARDLCRDALARNPHDIPLSLDLADALQGLAHADEAVELLQQLAEGHPDHPLIAGNLAAATNYIPDLSPSAIFEAHKRFAAALARNLPPAHPPPMTDPDPERPIRLGIIIPDLNRHSVAYFIRPVLERLDTSRFTLFIYYTGIPIASRPSAASDGLAPDWALIPHTARRIAWESLPRLDALIRADKLDMLMDLCGMSTQHRLQVMHLKPAPIQLTYAGYPNTTGLSSIDYRIVDSHTDPDGTDRYASEKLLRLDPCFLCYSPPLEAPAPSPPPSASGAPVSFGSFNHLPKLNGPLIHLWSRILAAVPDSRLVLKAQGLHHADVRRDIESRFTAAGIPADRLAILPPTPTRTEHLNTYGKVDIALDPFPYHGTTTTCEALFMGVPVVCLAGRTHVSRVGISLLRNVGLADLIASDPDQYVHIAISLANDPQRLRSLRDGLRQRLEQSTLCDEAAFSTRFQSALRLVWRRRCENPA